MTVAYSGKLDAQPLGLAIDALAGGALDVNGVVERASAIHQNAGATSKLVVDILLTSFAFLELLMFAGLSCRIREEKWAAIVQRPITIGVEKGEGERHAQADGTQRRYRRTTRHRRHQQSDALGTA